MSQNHPFIDGDKRTAFAATYTFLAINGARLSADAQETQDFVLALYEKNHFTLDRRVLWLRAYVDCDDYRTPAVTKLVKMRLASTAEPRNLPPVALRWFSFAPRFHGQHGFAFRRQLEP
jgi:hypothetical protein